MAVGTQPPYYSSTVAQVSSQMEVNVYCDVAAQLGSGQAIATSPAPTAVITDSSVGDLDVSSTSLVGSTTISGTRLVQVVKALSRGHNYLLTFVFATNPPDFTGEQLSAIQPIWCQY